MRRASPVPAPVGLPFAPGRVAPTLAAGRAALAFLLTLGAAAAAPALLSLLAPAPAAAQQPDPLRVVDADGEAVRSLPTDGRHGYRAVAASTLETLGWRAERAEGADGAGGAWRLVHDGGAVVTLVPGDPFFRWDGQVQQLVDPPYLVDRQLWVPAQLVLDFLPFHLPAAYGFERSGEGAVLVLKPGEPPQGEERGAPGQARAAAGETASARETPPGGPAADAASEPLVVVIDPGHGGRDLGAVGPGGTYEKDVALALGRALARELGTYPGVEVHLTRDSDVLVPLWQRGEWATEKKGERSGVFISLHANSLPSRAARGFETYFLSEARTEHERRVAAIENEPMVLTEEGGGGDTGLGFILNELRNLDHQHWSALLAELVQQRLDPVHPGPDRGVKQGPFAVITNALMPAVLVEVGFISNRDEERLLGRAAFHDDVARALAEAVVEFFQRYPPGRDRELGRPPSGPGP